MPSPDELPAPLHGDRPARGGAHAHAHRRVDLGPAPARLRLLLLLAVLPLVVATVAGLVWLWPSGEPTADLSGMASGHARGTVTEVVPCETTVEGCLAAVVDLEAGEGAPGEVRALLPVGPQAPTVDVGDEIVLSYTDRAPADQRYAFQAFDRTGMLTLLLGVFVASVLVLSRWRGLGSLASLALSLLMLVYFTLPALAEGASPLTVAIVTAAAIMLVTLYLSHGFTLQTTVAMLGTLTALVLTGVLGTVFVALGRFSGLSDEGSQYIVAVNSDVQVGGLLLAGLVIGALGVLDDVTVTQTAAMWELADADPRASRGSLFLRGMRIGRSHVASTVNTLAMAYVGTTLPLLLVLSAIDLPFGVAISQELVAQEIVRTLVGGIGIILAAPITAAIAAGVAGRLVATRPAERGTRH